MRWFWIDRYTEFVSGQSATALEKREPRRGPLARSFSRRAAHAQLAGARRDGANGRSARGAAQRFPLRCGVGEGRESNISLFGPSRRYAGISREDRRHASRRRIHYRHKPRGRPTAGGGGDIFRPPRTGRWRSNDVRAGRTYRLAASRGRMFEVGRDAAGNPLRAPILPGPNPSAASLSSSESVEVPQ